MKDTFYSTANIFTSHYKGSKGLVFLNFPRLGPLSIAINVELLKSNLIWNISWRGPPQLTGKNIMWDRCLLANYSWEACLRLAKKFPWILKQTNKSAKPSFVTHWPQNCSSQVFFSHLFIFTLHDIAAKLIK